MKQEQRKMLETVDTCTDVEFLKELNRTVVTQIRSLYDMKARSSARSFSVGQTVEFKDQRGQVVTGLVRGKGPKNLKVVTSEGARWSVSYNLSSLRVVDAMATFEMPLGGVK